MFTLLQIRDLRIVFTKKAVSKKRGQCFCPRLYAVLCVVFPVGIVVGVVHRAERLTGCSCGVSVLAFCLAMCYISKPKPRNNLYTKNVLM